VRLPAILASLLGGGVVNAAPRERFGVVAKEQFFAEAMRLAHQIAQRPPIALKLAKEAVLKADEMSLSEGLEYERKLFYSLFATEDQKEGMRALLEKRKAPYKGK